ncbi:unnamed protein product [Toxocara canis]|uniref:Velvet domain-containing protein n=1 Tax=Toxocara canis TaxID=6265 RepID=A0A183U3G0_TOXCA|nr:unnamed protein product [Toxocara canis]
MFDVRGPRHRTTDSSLKGPGSPASRSPRNYAHEMADGTVTRFHVNQLRKRESFEITLLDSFGLPNPATAAETTPARTPTHPRLSGPLEMSNTAQPPL